MNDKKLIDCLHENELKRLEGKIELLQEKVRAMSINMATYCADYEGKIAALKESCSYGELEYYKHACHYLNAQNQALTKSKEKLSKFINSSVRLLESEQSKYKEFMNRSKLGKQQLSFPLDTNQAIDFLNILEAKISETSDLQTNKDLEEKLKKLSSDIDTPQKGFLRIIKPKYKAELLLKELHKLIDGQKPRQYVPYILILWDEQVLDKLPSWKEMRAEFSNIGAESSSNYYKFLKYKLKDIQSIDHFPTDEVNNKRSRIKDILEKCEYKQYTDLPF